MKLFFILFLALPASVLARIGDTEADLIQCYGEPVRREGTNVQGIHQHGDRLPLDKTCQYEQYSRPGGLTDGEILQILSANSGGHEWAALDKPATPMNKKEWMRERSEGGSLSGTPYTKTENPDDGISRGISG